MPRMHADLNINCSIDFVLPLYIGSVNLSEVNAIDSLIGHCSFVA